MRMLKAFSLFVILAVVSLCPWLPDLASQEATPTATETLAPVVVESSPTPVDAPPEDEPSPTPEDQRPSPTLKAPALLPEGLAAISLENLPDLAVVGEIPYPEMRPDHLVFELTISRDGTKLAIGSQHWETRKTALVVWDLINNTQLLAIDDPPEFIRDISFSPDGEQLWAVRQGALDQYDLRDGSLAETIPLPAFTAIAISPDGRWVMVGAYQGTEDISTIEAYALGDLVPRYSEEMAYMISSFRFSPDSRLIAGTSATMGSTVTKVWQVDTGEEMMAFYDFTGGPVFSPDSSLAVLAKGQEFSLYATDGWTLLNTFQNDNTASTNQPKFIFGDNQILGIQETTRVTFNNVNTGAEVLAPQEQITLMAFSPALEVIFTNTNLENIKLWGVLP